MKNKWLGITLAIIAGVVLLVAVGFVSFRLGTMWGSRFASTEGITTIVGSGAEGELPEGTYLGQIPGADEHYYGMMGSREYFDDFRGMMGSYGFRDNIRGFYPMSRFNSPMRSFSLARGLFSLVLLAGLVLLIIFIVKAVKKTDRNSDKYISPPVPESVELKQE